MHYWRYGFSFFGLQTNNDRSWRISIYMRLHRWGLGVMLEVPDPECGDDLPMVAKLLIGPIELELESFLLKRHPK